MCGKNLRPFDCVDWIIVTFEAKKIYSFHSCRIGAVNLELSWGEIFVLNENEDFYHS